MALDVESLRTRIEGADVQNEPLRPSDRSSLGPWHLSARIPQHGANLGQRTNEGEIQTSVVRPGTFNQAMSQLIRFGRVVLIEDAVAGQIGKTVHAPGTQPVSVRELGERALDEVPYGEVRALMQQILDRGEAFDPESVKRRVLKEYGRTSLTRAASDYLDKVRPVRVEGSVMTVHSVGRSDLQTEGSH